MRGSLRRMVVAGVGLALALLLLLLAGEAKAGKYTVAQCGWYIGADADWADTTGGAKFRPDSYCVPPPGADPFDGAHMKSFTREDQPTVSGNRYARWRWTAPPATGITQIRGTWWHTLHDGMEQRIGSVEGNGNFDVFAYASTTDVTPRDFVAGFSSPQAAIEDRLLCARAEGKSCSLAPGSWSAVRALTITVEDDWTPAAGIGGEITTPGWHRGAQTLLFGGGNEQGSGIRYGESDIDGARVNLTEYPCADALIGGEWRATRMQPCSMDVSGSTTIDTTRFSDGPHRIHHCATDFAGNSSCTADQTVAIDNNPPAHPRNLTLTGGEDWHRVDDFDLRWENPDQGPASPIAGAAWRFTNSGGYDTGARFAAGRGLAALENVSVPGPGTYSLQLWLRDEAGNEAPASALTVPLRFDDVPPTVAFRPVDADAGFPEQIEAQVSDAHSGPASGTISYRRADTQRWLGLPTKLSPGPQAGQATLEADLPDRLDPGVYLFRIDAQDAAGNPSFTTRGADGAAEMTLRKAAPPSASGDAKPGPGRGKPAGAAGPLTKARVFAHLRWGRRRGPVVTVPFGASAGLGGRLVRADGSPLAGRELRVVSRPSRGALASTRTDEVHTGTDGSFHLALRAGPSRRITVAYSGEGSIEEARRPALELRVRGGIVLAARPRALRTGHAVRLSGRVRTLEAPLPRRGKLVAIQYYESTTRAWRPVIVTRTDHAGRFHAHYRFRYVTGSALIRLRALALPEERWPYAPGASAPVGIRVTG